MYWPSTSKDGVYQFDQVDSDVMSADDILNQYIDWRDISQWAYSTKDKRATHESLSKAGDPLDKRGMIGAFNRTYNIHEAIEEFLSNIYSDVDGSRYSYRAGSTVGGLVTYDDIFAYSHHETDPTSMRLCNAFDLVRIHKFGHLDDGSKETAPTKMPSYKEMCIWATEQPAIKRLLNKERSDLAREMFSDWDDPEPETKKVINGEGELTEVEVIESDEWMKELDVDHRGNTLSTISNVRLVMSHDRKLRGCFAFDELFQQIAATRNLPWRDINERGAQFIRDEDEASLRLYLEKTYGITSTDKIRDGLTIVSAQNRFNPVQRYLSGLHWDGKKRIDTILCDFLGAERCDYTYLVTRKTMVAAVARAMRPGIKFDNVLTLVGKQGLGKSRLFDVLGGEWFSDSFFTFSGKQAIEQIRGAWIIEIGEIANMRQADIETVKHFLSKRVDQMRGAYKRHNDIVQRACIFVATTNKTQFLQDDENRRFWPVKTSKMRISEDQFKVLTPEIIGQIWAEAVELYQSGESIYLSESEKDLVIAYQQDHVLLDDRSGMVEDFINRMLPTEWESWSPATRHRYINGNIALTGGVDDFDDGFESEPTMERLSVSPIEIWCELFGQSKEDFGRKEAKEIRDILNRISGWECDGDVKKLRHYGSQRIYTKSEHERKKNN